MNARILTAAAAILLVANVTADGVRPQGRSEDPAAPQPAAQAVKPPTPPPQSQPPAAKPAAPARSAAAPVARGAIALVVTDLVGKTVPGVRVVLSGAMSREGTTSRDGSLTLEGLRAGTYRLRFESADFITLEREVSVRTGPAAEVDVALDRAPAKTAEPPAPSQPANCRPAVAADANAAAAFLELPDWIQRNMIGRNDPQKEDVVGHTAVLTPIVIQVRDPTRQRVRDDADEVLYVIAGEGVLHVGGRDQSLDAGSLAVIPRGVTYTLERRGRNPLIALSIVGK